MSSAKRLPASIRRQEREKKVVDCILHNPHISLKHGAKLCNMSVSSFRKWKMKHFPPSVYDYDVSPETRAKWKRWSEIDNKLLERGICIINLYGAEKRRYNALWSRKVLERIALKEAGFDA